MLIEKNRKRVDKKAGKDIIRETKRKSLKIESGKDKKQKRRKKRIDDERRWRRMGRGMRMEVEG